MPRWYMLRSSRGNQENQKDHLRTFISSNRLSEYVPRFSMEKQSASTGKSKGEFYLLFTIESEPEGSVPALLNPLFSTSFAGRQISGSEILRYSDFEKFLGKEVETYNVAYYIKYQARPAEDDTFDLHNTNIPVQPVRNPAQISLQTDKMDKLLYWVSAMGKGSWEAFKKTCTALELNAQGTEARRVLRRLQLLGHLQVSSDGKSWQARPPTLIEISPGKYSLSGQRASRWMSDLKFFSRLPSNKLGEVRLEPQPEGNGPTCIYLKGTSQEGLLEEFKRRGIFSGLRLDDRAVIRFAQTLPDLRGWLDSLTAVEGLIPALYDFEQYDGNGFSRCYFTGVEGMYRLRHIKAEANGPQSYTFYYDAPQQRWLRGDWYGLRFASQAQVKAIPRLAVREVFYYTAEERLDIAEDQRWPEIYERALVQGTGQLPELHAGILRYSISKEPAQLLASKLGLDFREK